MIVSDQVFELFKQNNDIRNSIIQNFDNQTNNIKQVCLGLCGVIIGSSLALNNYYLLLLSSSITLFFWLIESAIKKNQRGYILINNQIQKSFALADTPEKKDDVINKYFFDLNGYYSFNKSTDIETTKWYKKQTSLFHTMKMRNVYCFYFYPFLCQIIFFTYQFLAVISK